MTSGDVVSTWIDWLTARGAAAGTRRVRGSHLRRLAARTDPLAATPGDIVAFMVANSHLKPESRKSLISSLRLFYSWALTGDLVPSDPTSGLGPVHVPPSVPRPISDADLHTAFVRADEEATLMLLLGCYAGLRRAEIAAVHQRDIDGLSLTVCGKGGRTRWIPVHPMLAGRLARVRDWAFPSHVRIGEHVGPDYVASRLEGVLPPPWTAHSLRHYFATKAYQGSHDIRAVQQLLGHSSLATTQRYVLVNDEAMRAAVLAVA